MIAYCESKTCLRRKLLGYFGEELKKPCNNCSVCLPDAVDTDITREGQMLLSCIVRVQRQGYQPGKELIYQILQGKPAETVTILGLDKLSTFGLMKGADEKTLDEVARRLEDCGYLEQTTGFCPMLQTTEKAKLLLAGKQRLSIRKAAPRTQRVRNHSQTENSELFQALKALRTDLAKRASVPAYVICTDATLRDMCRRQPQDMHAFRKVSGIGEVKAQRYGTAFLKVIVKHSGKS